MGALSAWHWLIVLAVALLLFGGRGKISALMGDLGKGLKAFKSNIKEETQDTPHTKPEELTSAEHSTEQTSSAREEHTKSS